MELPALGREKDHILRKAWEIRCSSFPPEVTFCIPEKTRTVSLTGTHCSLNCAHCGGRHLEHMVTLDAVDGETCGAESLLISGGFDSHGKVPFHNHVEQLFELKKHYKLNMHTGIVSREEARLAAQAANILSFDFTADERIIRDVYGLSASVLDYINSYSYLVEAAGKERVVPHITLGLYHGRLTRELDAVKNLGKVGLSRLVILIFVPTRGTRFQALSPPPVLETAELLARVRVALPGTPIYLGCMRPGGRYRQHLDRLALTAGVNKLVVPHRDLREYARELGLNVNNSEECCVL